MILAVLPLNLSGHDRVSGIDRLENDVGRAMLVRQFETALSHLHATVAPATVPRGHAACQRGSHPFLQRAVDAAARDLAFRHHRTCVRCVAPRSGTPFW